MIWLRLMKDARGRESTTLGFVTVAFWLVTLKYALAGLVYADGKLSINITFAGSGEYGAAIVLILGIWLTREWTEKRGPGAGSAPSSPSAS